MTPHRVAVLLLPPVIGYDATIPPQVLGSATDAGGHALYDVRMAGLDGAPVETLSGYTLGPQGDASLLEWADTVIVPGTRFPSARNDGTLTPEAHDALARVRPGTRLVSICTGAFVLAAAGLLDGRRATTHWEYAEPFRALYPDVLLDEAVLFVDDGDVLTSAGLSAGVDLCLHLIRTDHGAEVANRVARHTVVPPWRDGGQAQFIDTAVAPAPEQSTAAARAWAASRLDHPLEVADLAAAASMPLRTFTRRFGAETGLSPGAWLIQQRVRHAQRLLETTDLPVDDVASRSGLGSAGSLRAHLRTVAGVSPTAYRRTFRG
ncbi:GlxA family transcriptional regulator [Nocardioides marmoribigeumensis]|uniref:Transcriptional regulator GlxA family with amidase domain n=1 Tax=Nocardioides marmoribigeumensis TaxID=433649 RepID=A0ABU2BU94_9ACTN|nr:helix-turn-helix domain-containing protein [Nocardioides marmoribigeumensis]MDR7361851.1 transcriptional regulator GlxA family with amidase domain [Nocardioides marmoribigeumensis]